MLVLNRNCKLFDLLIDPFCNLGAQDDVIDYKGDFSGKQYGLVLGSNGVLDITDESYLDYVGLKNNTCPTVSEVPGFEGIRPRRILKPRNPSAFWVDGNHDPDALPALIQFGRASGLFFRSGVDKNGIVTDLDDETAETFFTVDKTEITPGMGEYVFIVEAFLDVLGSNDGDDQQSKIELLSLHVDPTGGQLFVDDDRVNFPKRTFTRTCDYEDDGTGPMCCYNKGAFLINDCVNFSDLSLAHTDVNHNVFEKNDIKSQPTYVGGEKWKLKDEERPKFSFFGSRFNVHSDVAVTGMDLTVPNRLGGDGDECLDNISKMVFYQNGKKIDAGTGRNMVLGTHIGALACDNCKIVNRDAHLDIMQTLDCDPYNSPDHKLLLDTANNNECITDGIESSEAISGQFATNNIYLGHSSNISVGTHLIGDEECPFEHTTNPMLLIDGNFFALCSRGGPLSAPSTTHLTGKGGIFVDKNGMFSIGKNYLASIGTMVTKSLNGVVNLPKEQVIFADHVGIADWKLDLTDEEQQAIVESGECVSDYTLNWLATKKDYDNFCPYIIGSANLCECPAVEQKNVTSLPTVEGVVNQLQIQASRIGDPAHIMIDSGRVRELVFLKTGHGGDAPVAVVALKNHGRVGIGSAHPNPDSLFASTTFGLNGVTIIADGDGRVDLNEDMIVDNLCAFVKGPNFNAETDKLLICSDVPRILLVKSTGILDFESFGENEIVEFCGQIRIILEPGAKILMDGGTVQFANDVVVEIDPFVPAQDFFNAIPLGAENSALNPLTPTPSSETHNPFAPLTGHGNGLSNTDDFRVKIIGTGKIQLIDDAKMFIDKDAFLGVETFLEETGEGEYAEPVCEIDTTDIIIELNDNSLFSLGGDRVDEGGSFQIGNTINREGHSISFTLLINGVNAKFRMGPQAFFGQNVGIVDRRSDVPNGWLVDVMNNVENITVNLMDGLFEESDIFAGDNTDAHLLAFGQNNALGGLPFSPLYSFLYEDSTTIPEQRASNATVQGGGNIIRLIRAQGACKPIVLIDDDTVDVGDGVQHPNMRVGILASMPLLPAINPNNVDANLVFTALKTNDASDGTTQSFNKANASSETPEATNASKELRLGYIDRDTIGRQNLFDIIDSSGGTTEDRRQKAADLGAVSVGLATQVGSNDLVDPAPAPVAAATQIQ